ncbi:transcriptional regulator [Spongiibacter sp. IMCC21906]|uniref:LysR family transcriptional regulator n=1 Tax=Spongiibacter sp. IMCC21906 TaxID=1620392 RepID=UPI00062DEEE5|nr:LysR family transcriptional regulator [Spongiibacter sp. IMCC21906]AKH70009.1 transcriptional regulator [Spongiibacter sp. IMCC21906]
MKGLDDLIGLRVFERVVTLGSLTAAAQDLGLSIAAASKRLAKLEARLGLQLIHRSTRRLSVSDEGKTLYSYAQRALLELDQAEEILLQTNQRVAGNLRITAPHSFGRQRLVPLLAPFKRDFPDLNLQLIFTDGVEDLIAGSIDVAIRYGQLPDSGMVARELLPNRRVLCASPDYLGRWGTPSSLDDLQQHQCIVLGRQADTEWRFTNSSVQVHGSICCNDGEAGHSMALQGMGIVLKSYWDVVEDLQSGQLIQVLPDHAQASAPISAVYLQKRDLAPRVRVFIDFLVAEMDKLRSQLPFV